MHCFNRECFIDASNEFVHEGNKNKLSDENIEKIYDVHFNKTEILDAVSPKLLPWTLYRELIRVEDAEARKWYEQEALRETWSSRTLAQVEHSRHRCFDNFVVN